MNKEDVLKKFGVTEKELCDRIRHNANDVVFLSGSLFDNLGNTRSDLDIFLITDDNNSYLNKERTIDQNIIIHNKRYDLSIFSESLIKETKSALNSLDFNDPNLYLPRQIHPHVTNYEICTMIHRIRIGSPIHNPLAFHNILTSFPFQDYIQWYFRIKLNEYDGLYEDVVGSLESDDLTTAEELVQMQIRIVSQLLVLSTGETFDRDKWIPRKIEQLVNRGLLNKQNHADLIAVKKSLAVGGRAEITKAVKYCEEQIENLQIKSLS